MSNQEIKSHRFLTFIAMLYLTIDLICLSLTYKFIAIGPIKTSIEIFLFPMTYTLTDIIAEVYGYNEAKKIIWFVFICDFIFALCTFIGVHVSSYDLLQQQSYISVFGSLLRASTAEILGVLSGIFINIYVISKLKIRSRGKYFWLRSVASSTLGEAVLLIISVPIIFIGIVDITSLMWIMGSTYLYKILFAVIIAFPANFFASLLKKKEGIDVFDYNTKFSPFIIER